MIPTREKIAYALAAVILIAAIVLLIRPAWASGGPVRPFVPSCSDTPKSSIVELDPAGTMNALAQITYTVPFCPGGKIVTLATVDNGNTAGERVGAKPFGLTHINVSIQLDAPSSGIYLLYWRAEKATQ